MCESGLSQSALNSVPCGWEAAQHHQVCPNPHPSEGNPKPHSCILHNKVVSLGAMLRADWRMALALRLRLLANVFCGTPEILVSMPLKRIATVRLESGGHQNSLRAPQSSAARLLRTREFLGARAI